MIANCGRDPRVVDIGPEWASAELLLANLPETPVTSGPPRLQLAGWDARIYSAATLVNTDHLIERHVDISCGSN